MDASSSGFDAGTIGAITVAIVSAPLSLTDTATMLSFSTPRCHVTIHSQ